MAARAVRRENQTFDIRFDRVREISFPTRRSASRRCRDRDCAKRKSPRRRRILRGSRATRLPAWSARRRKPAPRRPRAARARCARRCAGRIRACRGRSERAAAACARAAKRYSPSACPDAFERRVIERVFARNSADAVRAEKLFRHWKWSSPLAQAAQSNSSIAAAARVAVGRPAIRRNRYRRTLADRRARAIAGRVAQSAVGDGCAIVTQCLSKKPRSSPQAPSAARIIAAGIVIAFCYWASTVLVTLLVAVLMAYFLDPVVSWLETLRVFRARWARC